MNHPASLRATPRRIGMIVGAIAIVFAACGPSEEQIAANRTAAVEVLEEFGTRLAHVQKLAPREDLVDQIRDHYGPYVTTLLLGGWITDPGSAPGRQVSSPWPERIEVVEATPVGATAYDIAANVVYVTSVEGDPVMREPVAVRLVRGEDGIWRISEWTPRRQAAPGGID